MRGRVLGAVVAAGLAAGLLASSACGGDTPSSPSEPIVTPPPPQPPSQPPTLTAPEVDAPPNDAQLDTLRPTLRVRNATSDQAGIRTYEFQISDNDRFDAAAGSWASLLPLTVTKVNVPEGENGKTSYTLEADLQVATRYYWRARAQQNGTDGPWSAAARFRSRLVNVQPRITALTLSANRAEIDEEIEATCTAEPAVVAPAELVYEWSAQKGAFIGSGSRVRWRAPGLSERTPASYDITATVVERYSVLKEDGTTETREGRASASSRVYVNNSLKEINEMGIEFLQDFADSSRSPEYVVRNFSDNCRGKADELGDIQRNRETYTILSHTLGNPSTTFNTPRTFADSRIPCQFTARIKATGQIEVATGECQLTAVYENWRWWLCDSHFRGTTTSGLRFIF